MAVFLYTASRSDSSLVQGTLTADTPRQARDKLRERGLSVVKVWTSDAEQRRSRSLFTRLSVPALGGRHTTAVTALLRELATLLEVGMPLLEALDVVANQQRGAFRRVVLSVRERVAAGESFAEAMRAAHDGGRRVFDEIVIAMTEVGEYTGTLDHVLQQLADYREASSQLKGKLSTCLLYPALVLLTGLGVSIFLMTAVVPGLIDSLTEVGQQLPWITRVVKGFSDAILRWGWLAMVVAVLTGVAVVATWSTTRGRYLGHRLLLSLPLIGTAICKQTVARIAFVIAALMRSGIPLERAVAIAQKSTRNMVLGKALERCELAIHDGRDIGDALSESRAFPETVIHVFALGQESGCLEDMLERLSRGYTRQVDTLTSRLTALLEPALILLLAVIVGMIAFATILPILEMGNVL